jgi:enoyl-CoA hydratase/carnithine racemase
MVEEQRYGAVHLIALNRTDKLNAFNSAMYDALTDALLAAEQDDAVNVVVITGRGRVFTAGADLAEMGGRSGTPARHGFNGLVATMIDYTKPVIVGVNGAGIGIGGTLCGLADLVFMAESASIRVPFAALGINPEAGSSLTFPQLLGPQHAAWLLYSAESMSAADCVRTGFALEVFPNEEFLDQVLTRAQTIAAQAPNTLRETKRLLMLPKKELLQRIVADETATLGRTVGSPENREAIAAFLEKRLPDFSKVRQHQE